MRSGYTTPPPSNTIGIIPAAPNPHGIVYQVDPDYNLPTIIRVANQLKNIADPQSFIQNIADRQSFIQLFNASQENDRNSITQLEKLLDGNKVNSQDIRSIIDWSQYHNFPQLTLDDAGQVSFQEPSCSPFNVTGENYNSGQPLTLKRARSSGQ